MFQQMTLYFKKLQKEAEGVERKRDYEREKKEYEIKERVRIHIYPYLSGPLEFINKLRLLHLK